MKKFYQKFKETASNAKSKLFFGAAGVGMGMLALPGMSFAAFSAEETAMITFVETKVGDLISAVSTIATANLGLIATMVVAALIFMYMKSAGR